MTSWRKLRGCRFAGQGERNDRWRTAHERRPRANQRWSRSHIQPQRAMRPPAAANWSEPRRPSTGEAHPAQTQASHPEQPCPHPARGIGPGARPAARLRAPREFARPAPAPLLCRRNPSPRNHRCAFQRIGFPNNTPRANLVFGHGEHEQEKRNPAPPRKEDHSISRRRARARRRARNQTSRTTGTPHCAASGRTAGSQRRPSGSPPVGTRRGHHERPVRCRAGRAYEAERGGRSLRARTSTGHRPDRPGCVG